MDFGRTDISRGIPARRIYRLTRLGLHLAHGLFVAGIYFPLSSKDEKNRLLRKWSGKLLDILNIKLSVKGDPPEDAPALLVANHISWLDIYIINSVCPSRFIAKSEVQKWPMIGWLSKKTGTLFVERQNKGKTLLINQVIAEAMASGDRVAFFPEGTTTDGYEIKPFKSPLMQSALNINMALLPAAIRYTNSCGSINTQVAFIGETTLTQSIWIILGQKAVHAEIFFAEPIETSGHDRKSLAKEAREVIATLLRPHIPGMQPETSSYLPDAAL